MTQRHTVLVSLAANCDAEQNLSKAHKRLAEVLSHLEYSQAIWTEPIGTKRKDLYLNQLAKGECEADYPTLSALLKDMEADMGRTQEDRQAGIVRIDLDILLFDDVRHHEKDWQRPYVKRLLPEVMAK